MHYIHVHNKSGHDQEFEVHGFNNNKNLTVKPGTTATFDAPDSVPGTQIGSGAVIALHDGHECEQAEITKKGFGGMSDVSPMQANLKLISFKEMISST